MERLIKNKYGQWSLKKEDEDEKTSRAPRGGVIHNYANQYEFHQHLMNDADRRLNVRLKTPSDLAAMSHISSNPSPNTPIVQAKNLKDEKEPIQVLDPLDKLSISFQVAKEYNKHIDKRHGVPEEEFVDLIKPHGYSGIVHEEDNHDWGEKVHNLQPEDIIHHANFTPDDMRRLNRIWEENGGNSPEYSSVPCRDGKTGRIFAHMHLKNVPGLEHLDQKFLPTNFHETDPPIWTQRENLDGIKPSLSGADQMGVFVKRPSKSNN